MVSPFYIKKLKRLFFLAFFIYTTINASTLNLSISSNPSRINPILASDSASSEISQWIFNGLFKYNKDGKIVNDLAFSHKFINNKTLKVSLKQNIKWHDGKEFTSDDVIFTYNKIIDPKIFTSLKSSFMYVKDIQKIDKYTFIIHYKEAYYKALNIWMTGILPKHIYENESDMMNSKFNKKPIGTGPYKLNEFKISSNIILIANDEYFDKRPKIDKINYKFIADSNTLFFTLKQQNLDIGSLTPLQIDRQISNHFKDNFMIIEKPSFGYTYLGFNLNNDKFKDINVRKALSLGINRQELVDILFFGHGKVCTGPFLPDTFAFNNNILAPNQNISKAKQLLNKAGYTPNHPLEFEVVTNANNSIRVYAAQILQYQLAKIGVNMHIRIMEWQAFLNTVVMPKKYETILLGWGLSLMPDAKPLWHSSSSKKGGFNLVNYSNLKVDELIEEGAKTIDNDKLSVIYKKIFKHITDDIPYLFLYIPNSISVVNKDIENIEPAFTGFMHNQKDWIKK
jgi:peptide/nickel transport system substrate-binding protein